MSNYFKNKLSLFLVLSLVVGFANFSPSHAGTVIISSNGTAPGPINILSTDTLIILNNVTLHITGSVVNAGVLVNQGTLKIDGDFNSTISGRTRNDDSLMIAGNYTNTSSVFSYGGTVFFNGLAQTIFSIPSSKLYFNNLTVTGGTKSLNGSLILGGQLDLETIIQTTATDTLGVDSSGTITGLAGFTNHYVQGPIYRRGRNGSTSDPVGMVFPVADANGVYRPLVLYSMPRYLVSNNKPIIKVQAKPAVPPGSTYAGGILMPMSWDMELVGGKFDGGATVELVYTPADIGATPPGTLAVLQAGTAGAYSSLGKLIATTQGIISVKKALLPLGSPTSMAVGTGCPAITASIAANPASDTICTGGAATFNVNASAAYDSVYYYVNGVLKLKDVAGTTFTSSTLADKDTVTALISSGGGICIDTMAKKIIMRVLTVTPNAGQDQTICSGAKATLAGTSIGGGTWSASSGAPPGGGTFAPSTTTLNATYTPSAVDIGVNSVTLRLSSKLCPSFDVMVLTILPTPLPPVVSVSNITSTGMKFSWPAVTGPGVYTISIDGGAFIAPNGAGSLSHTLTGLAPGTTHTGQVKFTSPTCGNSISNVASGTTLPAAIASCDSSWTVAGAPFCIASLKSKLTPTVSGGVFTGTGVIFIAPDYYFDPSVSGAGTFSITYTQPCTKFLTKSILVNDAPCVTSITPVGSAAVPLISNPQGIASDCDGSVYFSDTDNDAIWGIDPFGNASVLIGDTLSSGDGTGVVPPASGVKLNKPEGLVAYNGDIYFADAFNNKIKKYTKSTGMVSLIAGTGGALNFPPSPAGTTSTAATAQFKTPSAVTIDVTGTILYVADRGNKAIKKIDMTSGTVTYIATTLTNPASIALYGNSLYFSMPSANSIGVVDLTTNAVSTYYKLTVQPPLAEQPYGLSLDCQGKVYYTDAANGEVRVVTSSTTSTSLVPGLNNPTALSVYNKGFVDIANSGSNQILRYAISNWKSGAFNGLDTTHCVYDAADALNPLTCNVAGGFSFSGKGIQLVAGTYKFNPAVAGVGRHKIVYKFNAGFCQDSLIEYANVYPKPLPNLGSDQSICANNFGLDSLHAGKNGTKPYNPYQWFSSTTTGAAGTYSSVGGNTEYFVPPLPAGSPVYYAVQVTDTNGCIGADTIKLTKLAVTAVSILGTDSICYGATSSLSTQPAGFTSYSWNTGAVTSSISTTQSGDYIVNATGANGCISADTFRVTVRSLPAVCITAPAIYGYGVWNVSTIAGSTANASGTTDNVKGTLARFNTPWDIYFNNGNLYVTEAQRVRKIRITDTLVTTFAGSLAGTVTDSIQRLSAKFVVPKGIVADKAGNFYVANRDYIAI
jgi:streptogramin lyase